MKKPLMQSVLQVPGALVGWFAIVLQFYLLIVNRTQPLGLTILQFFSYFTILTNISVAFYFSLQLFRPRDWPGAAVSTALAVYITIVGLIYNLVLRQLWSPQGWQRLVDELLHTVVPLFFIGYWLLFFRRRLPWKSAFPWLIYPLAYLAFILVRGAALHAYPYPFMDVTALGYGRVALNSAILCLVFLAFSFVFIGLSRIGRRS